MAEESSGAPVETSGMPVESTAASHDVRPAPREDNTRAARFSKYRFSKFKSGVGGRGRYPLHDAPAHKAGNPLPSRWNCLIYDSRRDRNASKFCGYFNGPSLGLGRDRAFSVQCKAHHCTLDTSPLKPAVSHHQAQITGHFSLAGSFGGSSAMAAAFALQRGTPPAGVPAGILQLPGRAFWVGFAIGSAWRWCDCCWLSLRIDYLGVLAPASLAKASCICTSSAAIIALSCSSLSLLMMLPACSTCNSRGINCANTLRNVAGLSSPARRNIPQPFSRNSECSAARKSSLSRRRA